MVFVILSLVLFVMDVRHVVVVAMAVGAQKFLSSALRVARIALSAPEVGAS